MKIQKQTTARDFKATTIDGNPFNLSALKGNKILLSFYRNGACAICNLRVHELIKRTNELSIMGLKIVAIFESSIADMKPFVGKQKATFTLLSDPEATLYNIYGVESSEEKINHVMQNSIASDKIEEAAENGFPLIKQEGSNFFRMPADFLIDKTFIIKKWHYSNEVVDHMPIEEIIEFARN